MSGAEALRGLLRVAAGTTERLALLLRGGGVRRFHQEATMRPQSVAEHSWRVAVIAYDLWPDRPQLVLAALLHDTAEGLLGDVPAPIKRLPKLRIAYAMLEDEYEVFLEINDALDLAPEDHARLKVADCMELALTCGEQVGPEARRVRDNALRYIEEHGAALPLSEYEIIRAALAAQGLAIASAEGPRRGVDHPRPFGYEGEE